MSLRIVDYNYPFESGVTVAVSSEDPSFPAENLAKFSRSYCWRSSTDGQFSVPTTKHINFKLSGGGSQLTATIAAGTYSGTTLAAAIKTAMQTADPSNTYTVTKSATTGLWTISTSGGYLTLLWLTGTNAATSIAGTIGHSTTADQSGSTSYTGTNIAIHTEETIDFDLGTTEEVDTIAFLFDPLTGMNLTANALVYHQAGHTNNFSSAAVTTALSLDLTNEQLLYYYSSVQSYRHHRFLIADAKNPNLQLEIGKIILGKYTSLTRGPGIEWKSDVEDTSRVERTAYGHEYVDTYPAMKSMSFNVSYMPYADAQTLQTMYRRVGMQKPVFAQLYNVAFGTGEFCIYGKFNKGLSLTQSAKNHFTTELNLREVF
jgi:hypothetical protein